MWLILGEAFCVECVLMRDDKENMESIKQLEYSVVFRHLC